jgi:hypothetical protein
MAIIVRRARNQPNLIYKGMLMYGIDDANWFECAVNKPTFTEVVGINAKYPGDS